MRSFKNASKSKGFTLIEVMVVLIIGIIIIAAAAAGITRGFSTNEAATETRNITDLIASSQVLKGGSGFPADMVPALRSTGSIPSSLIDDGEGIKNSWGGDVTVAGSGNSFVINYAGVPKSQCVLIAQKVANAGGTEVKVGTTVINPDSTTPVSDQAATSCSDAKNNTLVFSYSA